MWVFNVPLCKFSNTQPQVWKHWYRKHFTRDAEVSCVKLTLCPTDILQPVSNAHNARYWTGKHLLRDAEMACPARRAAFWFGRQAKVYVCQFNHVTQWQVGP